MDWTRAWDKIQNMRNCRTRREREGKARTAGVEVRKEGAAYRVVGTKIERLAAMTEFASEDGRAYFDRVLLRSGARRKLEKLGAQPGDRIRVGAVEYTFS